jgi:protein-S-isoprenylcysteine O-methyltransferase Ste14
MPDVRGFRAGGRCGKLQAQEIRGFERMQALIATSHWHLIALYVAMFICYAPEWVGTYFQNPEKGAVGRDRGSYALLLIAIFAGIFLAFFCTFGFPAATITFWQPGWFWLGIALILGGAAFRWYAIKVLGKFFTRSVATRAQQTVVQHGPYRLIRHPSYSGALLSFLGVGLAMTNWLSVLAIMAFALAGYGYRVRVEERALSADLGQPYGDYMRRTRRFVPYVW